MATSRPVCWRVGVGVRVWVWVCVFFLVYGKKRAGGVLSGLLLHALNNEQGRVEETLRAVGDAVCFPGGEFGARFGDALVPAGVGELGDDLLHGGLLVLLLDKGLHCGGGGGVGGRVHFFFFFFVASGCRLDVYGGWGVGWGGEEGGRGDGGGGLKLGKGGLGFGGGAWERGRAVDKESRPGVGLPVGGDLNDGRWETTVGVRWDLGGSGGPGCPC